MKVQEQKKTNFSYDINNELYALGGRTVQFLETRNMDEGA